MKFENTAANDTLAQYVSFGWGDKGFYLETPTWADLKFSTAFKAMFYLDKTAIHSSFYRKMKEDDDCIKIKISKEQYQKMIVYVNQSFEKDKDGNVMLIKGKSYGNRDAFYEATGTYGLFNTCNTWANGGLKYCNLKACVWTTFDKGIFYQYKKK